MTVYVYGYGDTKEIVTITKQQLVGDTRVEVQIADDHPLVSTSDGTDRFRLNLTNDGIEEVFVTKQDVLTSVQKHRERMAEIGSTLTIAIITFLAGTHTPEEALAVLQAFNLQHAIAKLEWWESNNMKIAADLALPDLVNEFWLGEDISPGVTFRDYLITQFTTPV
jgi:hypothetical protein